MQTLSHHSRWTERVSHRDTVLARSVVGSRPTETAISADMRHIIPLSALIQRLSLLASIELPCVIQTGNVAREPTGNGPVKGCGRRNGRFWLTIGNLTLELQESMIETVRLSTPMTGGRPDTGIDIVSVNGNVVARISSLPDQANSAVWQDIMDTFDCA
ncbi:hypothetical protein [Methylotetracoccus oryzae]|uniref:hypothetical protein n=1 Tax=Methylotetracoccus oryzae TaxID=1919059 RepID=UPI001118414D|nr:hypothetical protein [Methylotetracoccus oryzae]